MTKVLYLPLNNSEITQTGMYDGFRACNVDLQIFDFDMRNTSVTNTRRDLIDLAKRFSPDLLHMQLQFTSIIDPPTLIEIKKAIPNIIITNWTGDVRNDIPPVFVNIGRVVDLSLISSTGQLDSYKKLIGENVKYWQVAYDHIRFFPQNLQSFNWDAVFAASNHTNSRFPGQAQREQTVRLLNSEFGSRFGLFGLNWREPKATYVNYYSMNNIYSQSLSCISVSNYNNLANYFSDRLLMCMASGRPTVALAFPGWENYFIDGVDILIAHSPVEIMHKVRWLKANLDKANAIGLAGYTKVKKEHTYHSRVAELLDMVGLA